MFDNEELLDYDETDDTSEIILNKESRILQSSFNNFHLKSELIRGIQDRGHENPSEVQNQIISQMILGNDILCEAQSGIGKTTAYVIATLQLIQPIDNRVEILVLCHTVESAFSIEHEYKILCKYVPHIKIQSFCCGVSNKMQGNVLKKDCPHIVIGTPGRILQLVKEKILKLNHIKQLIIDNCDRIFESHKAQQNVLDIYYKISHNKQVLIFGSTFDDENRSICKTLLQNPLEININVNTIKNKLHYYVKVHKHEKRQKLCDLLEKLDFHQVIIFVKSEASCHSLSCFLMTQNFPAVELHRGMQTQDRLKRLKEFQDFKTRILVTTDSSGLSINANHVTIVLNYHIPNKADIYLERAARLGLFNEKGLVLSCVSGKTDATILNEVQSQYQIQINKMPDSIDYEA